MASKRTKGPSFPINTSSGTCRVYPKIRACSLTWKYWPWVRMSIVHLPGHLLILGQIPSSSELSAFQSLGHWFIPDPEPFQSLYQNSYFLCTIFILLFAEKRSLPLWENYLGHIDEKGAISHPFSQGKRSSCCPHYNLSLESSSQPATLKSPHSYGHLGSNGSRPNLFFCILRPKHNLT